MERYKGGTGLSKVMMRRERLDDRRATQQKQPDRSLRRGTTTTRGELSSPMRSAGRLMTVCQTATAARTRRTPLPPN